MVGRCITFPVSDITVGLLAWKSNSVSSGSAHQNPGLADHSRL